MSVVDLEHFDQLVEKLIEEQERLVIDQHAALASSVHRELRADSPVLTGEFRDSWTPYVGTMPTAPGGGADESVFKTWKPGLESGEVNNQPYSVRLASGLSKQRRNGWIKTAITRGINRAKS